MWPCRGARCRGSRAASGGLLLALSLVLWLPGAKRAFHVDDPNFLMLAQHVRSGWLELYNFQLNWGGTPERAFDILSNPPGGPWLLYLLGLLGGGQEWVYHLGFLPLLWTVLWGSQRLGRRFLPADDSWLPLLVLTSPALVLSSHSLMPDLPMLAFLMAGLALSIEALDARRSAPLLGASLLLGGAALFRYNGLLGVALIGLYGLLTRKSLGRVGLSLLGALLPSLLWAALSFDRYGAVHLLASASFQGEVSGWAPALHTAIYQASSLSLAVALPGLVLWCSAQRLNRSRREPSSGGRWEVNRLWALGTLSGLGLGLGLAYVEALPVGSSLLLCLGLGGTGLLSGAALQALVPLERRGRTREARDSLFLVLWLGGVLLFNERLRFGSVRYLLPALLPALLILLRGLERPLPRYGVLLPGGLLSLWLGFQDAGYANAIRDAAVSLPPPAGQRFILGHWGWQHYLEAEGGVSLSQDACSSRADLLARDCPRPGDELVRAAYPWPQSLPEGLQVQRLERRPLPGLPGVRTLSLEARACFYSDVLAPGPLPVLLPYAFSSEPWDVIERLTVVESRRSP